MRMRSKLPALPYIVWMILFTIIPLGLIVVFAFTDENMRFTLANMQNTSKYIHVLIKSIYLSVVATVICLVIAYPLAFIMSRKSHNTQRMMQMLVMLPMWMNFLLRTYAWMTLLEDNGLINSFLNLLHLPSVHMINTQGAVILGMVYNYLPFMILPLYSIMTKIDQRVIEAAQDLGANTLMITRKVVFPLSFPGIATGITMTFIPAVSTFIISSMLGGTNNYLIGDLIEQQFMGNEYNLNYGAATSLLLMVVVLISMGVFNQFDNDEMEDAIR